VTPFDLKDYQPTDTLYLWWLGQPEAPRLVGELCVTRQNKGVSLAYDAQWLATGFALSEDLPLMPGEFLPAEKETAAGAVDDARPDRWGERVIRLVDKPPRLAVLDFLFYAGDERLGALGVSVSRHSYTPRPTGPLPQLADVAMLERLIQQVLHNEPVDPAHQRLLAPGATLGGARPKALLNMDASAWVLKFNEPGDAVDSGLVEHASMQLAAQAGIRVAQTRPIAVRHGHAVAVQRFDRPGQHRIHAISARVALLAAHETMGYPELAQWLRRRGVSHNNTYRAHMAELFRRMVFNILIDNTDDHEKNHVLLMTASGEYALSPAFDVLPSGQALGYQQMRVGTQGTDATLDNALTECSQFGLSRAEAAAHMSAVCQVVDAWQTHFAAAGVGPKDIETLAAQIDRGFLRRQREARLGRWSGAVLNRQQKLIR